MANPSGIVTIRVVNAKELRAAFAAAPMKVSQAVHGAIQRSILAIEGAAKREAPVNKGTAGGNLRQSITSRMTGPARGEVQVGVEYGIFVEEGTKPHIIRPLHKRVLASRSSGRRQGGEYTYFGREVHHPGTRPNPFFQRGVDRAQPQVDRFFVMAMEDVLRSL